MTVSYADWLAAQGQDRSQHQAKQAAIERAVRTLGTQMEDLVASEDWATYRKALEVSLESERAVLSALREQILAPDTVGEVLLKLKLQAAQVAGRVEGLELALRVPTTYQQLASSMAEA